MADLVAMLGSVADPRAARGVRHGIGAVLAVTVFAALAGARNFREAGDRAAELPQRLLRLAGCRRHPLSGRYVAPSEPTIRRIAHGIDADAADARVGAWLRAQVQAAAMRAPRMTELVWSGWPWTVRPSAAAPGRQPARTRLDKHRAGCRS